MKVIKRTSADIVPSVFDELFGKNWVTYNDPKKTITPAVNVREDAEGFKIDMAVPGMNKKDFNIQLEKDTIIISYDKKERKSVEEKNYTRREFELASFKRAFIIPEAADQEKITANYQDGILTINIPKQEKEMKKAPRVISIK